MLSRTNWRRHLALGIGVAVSIYGAAVLAAWYAHFIPLIQVSPGQPPLTRQGAMAGLLSGTGLAFLAAGRRRVAAVCATIVLLVAVVVGLEYALDRDLGIDQLLGSGYITEGASPPGRISPVAAISYFGCGLALLALSIRSRYASAIAGVIASVLIVMGSVLFLVYWLVRMPAYGWGHFRHISIQTAAVLVFLGVGILSLALEESRMRKTLPQWLPLAIGLGLAVGALGIWNSLMAYEEGDLPLLWHIILAGGILSASLVGIAVYLAQKATLRSRELQEGKAAFERLFEAAPDALIVTDGHGRITGANQRVESVFGYTRDELLGQPIENLVPEELREVHKFHRESYYGSPSIRAMGRELDLHAWRKDGSEFPVEVSLSPLRSGAEMQVLEVVRDITERKQAQEDLRQSEERFRGVFETSPLGLSLLTPDLRLAKVNPSLCHMLGYPEAELTGMNAFILIHLDDLRKSKALAERLFKGEIPSYQVEERFVKKSGEIIWTNKAATIIRDQEGRPLLGLCMFEDITERKREQEALRQSEERFRGVFETSPIGLALLTRDFRLAKVNPSLCRMLGYSEAELTGMGPFDLTHPDDLQKTKALAERLFRGEIPSYKVEKRYVKKNGEIIWTNMSATILRDQQGQPLLGLSMLEDITERKQAQEALRQSEERFRSVFEQGPIGVTLMGTDCRFFKVNAAFCRMLGYSEAELTTKTPLDITYRDDLDATASYIERFLKMGAPLHNIEKRYVKKSGEIMWASLNASAIHDQEGRTLYAIGMTEDITERKRAEEELRTLSQRMSQAIRFGSMSVWEWDPRGNYFVWDDAAFEIAGIPKEVPLPYEQFVPTVHPEDLPRAEAALQRVVVKKTQESVEYRVIRPDGAERCVYAAGGPILDRQGNVARVVGIAVDITQRKRAEEELRTLSQRLSLAAQSASMGVWELDLRTGQGIWDDRMFQIFGMPKQASVAREDWASRVHPDDRARAEAMLATAVRGKTQDLLEFRIIRPDGSVRYVSAAGGPVVDKDGNLKSIVGIARDVTERKQLEEDLEAARERAIASARLSALGMMAGGIAHEINNPLSIIHAMASDLAEMVDEKGAAPSEVVARKSAVIRETAERIARIVKSLRQISREGSSDLFDPTPVAKILAETLEVCRAKFEAYGVELLLPQTIPELSVPCREVQIAQALLNLLQNAFDAVLEQEGERWVRLEVEPTEGLVAISVIDSGPGIPPEFRSRMMEPFFTTKPVGKGTGLGLSLSKTIAEDHGGKLEYGEDHGHTRFSLILPLAKKAEAA